MYYSTSIFRIAFAIQLTSFQNRIMTVIAAGQFLLTTMILGVKIFGIVLGKSPFVL